MKYLVVTQHGQFKTSTYSQAVRIRHHFGGYVVELKGGK